MIDQAILRNREALESHSRANYQATYLGPDAVLCRVLGRYLMYVDPKDEDITPHLCMDGFWESWITLAMARLLQPGMFCVDVGANHGYYSLLMASAAGSEGRVLAFEPNAGLAHRIRLNARANGYADRIEVLENAAADASGRRVDLVFAPGRAANGTICRPPSGGDRVSSVDTRSIDDATADWQRVDLVKIDAEGAEDAIWTGMSRTIDDNPGLTVFLEFTPAAYADAAGFLDSIEAVGLGIRHVDPEGEVQPVSRAALLDADSGPGWSMLCLAKRWQ